jgi:hypothetical protein
MYIRCFPFTVVVWDTVPEAWFVPQPGDGLAAKTLSNARNRVSEMTARILNAIGVNIVKQ